MGNVSLLNPTSQEIPKSREATVLQQLYIFPTAVHHTTTKTHFEPTAKTSKPRHTTGMTMARDTSARSSISSASSHAPAPEFAGPATTPAPLTHQHSGSSAGGAGPRSPRPRRRVSSAADADSARELWARMLEVQERYGCYRSARMQAAVDSGQAADLMREFLLHPFPISSSRVFPASFFPLPTEASGTAC